MNITHQLAPQMRVRHKESGQLGTIWTTIYLLTSDGDDELSIVYDNDGKGGTTITLNCEGGREAFEIIGPENAIADPKKCGAGLGKECCIFLVAGSNGFECARYSSMRYDLQFRTMNAKRDPSAPYPLCQIDKLWMVNKNEI